MINSSLGMIQKRHLSDSSGGILSPGMVSLRSMGFAPSVLAAEAPQLLGGHLEKNGGVPLRFSSES